MILILVCMISICGGFLLDGKTQAPPTPGSVMTDEHYNFLMQFIFQERQSRLQLEAEVKQLKLQVTSSQTELASKMHELQQCGCAADVHNKTFMIETELQTLKQSNDALSQENLWLQKENGLIRNKTTKLETEVSALKSLKTVADLNAIMAIQNQTKHLELEIQATNNRQEAIKSEADARKQDFMALFQNVQLTELDIQSNKQSLEIALENVNKSITDDQSKLSLKVSSLESMYLKERVAFTVSMSSTDDSWSGSTLVFNKVIYEIGGGYDTSTGIFTAPVDGHFVFYIAAVSYNNYYIYLDIVLNNVSKVRTLSYTAGYETGTNLVGLQLQKGDKVWIKRYRGTGYYNDGPMTTFSGFRIF